MQIGVRWGSMGSDWVPMGSDVVRLGPMGSDWVISHTQGVHSCLLVSVRQIYNLSVVYYED